MGSRRGLPIAAAVVAALGANAGAGARRTQITVWAAPPPEIQEYRVRVPGNGRQAVTTAVHAW